MPDLPVEAQLIPLTDRLRHIFHKNVCECKICKGVLNPAHMCLLHLMEDYFLEIGKVPKLVADRLLQE